MEMAEEAARIHRRKELGALLRKARIGASKSRTHCADLLGTSTQVIAALEHGETDLTFAQLTTLARFLDVPVSYFWSETLGPEDKEWAEDEPSTVIPQRMALRQKLLGVQLRQARQNAGKSQRESAELLNVTMRRISEYEYGQRDIPFAELEELAAFYQVPIETFFLNGEDRRTPPAGPELPATGEQSPTDLAQPASSAHCPDLEHLPPELREFVRKPVNLLYLRLAQKLSSLPSNTIREIGESLLDITY